METKLVVEIQNSDTTTESRRDTSESNCVVSWELTISPNVLSLSTLDNNTTIFSLSPEDV
jgi:hypothetical protein